MTTRPAYVWTGSDWDEIGDQRLGPSVTALTNELAAKVDYALTANAQSGTGASAYTFALADASRLTTATGTSAKTFTIPPQANVTWVANSIIRVANYGAGDLTIAGGSGVTVTNATKTLAQYESAAVVRTGSNAWTLIPFSGGAGNADFSNAATGTYTDGGISYKYVTFTASGTLTVTKAGFADVLVVGGGGGGGNQGGGGGAGGYLSASDVYFSATTHTVIVGAGGAGADANATQTRAGANGVTSRVGSYYSTGGGGGGGYVGGAGTRSTGYTGGSGGGAGQGGALASGGAGTSGQGNAGGNNTATSASGGGGGANAAGSNGVAGPVAGNGGSGLASSITGSSITRAGGGGGGSRGGTAGSGGSGGGGAGTTNNTTGTAGTGNTGGGGGGGGYASGAGGAGGAGGSGVVIVRVKV